MDTSFYYCKISFVVELNTFKRIDKIIFVKYLHSKFYLFILHALSPSSGIYKVNYFPELQQEAFRFPLKHHIVVLLLCQLIICIFINMFIYIIVHIFSLILKLDSLKPVSSFNYQRIFLSLFICFSIINYRLFILLGLILELLTFFDDNIRFYTIIRQFHCL